MAFSITLKWEIWHILALTSLRHVTVHTCYVQSFRRTTLVMLDRQYQAKIYVGFLIIMDIRCEHPHRLELRKSFKFWVAVAT